MVKIDNVVNLVGEMVIIQFILLMIGQEVVGNLGEKFNVMLEELFRNIWEIQEVIMLMCMIYVFFVFNCFFCLVCDLVKILNKKIDFVIEGGEIEVDKSMIEKFVDLFMYLVRNSFDYGIELLEKCLVVGKFEVGIVIFKVE